MFFSFKQVKYKSVLILSVLIFGIGYINDVLNEPQSSETINLVVYMLGIAIASFWGI